MPQELWNPTITEMVSGYIAVLCDKRHLTNVNALFIHASPGDPQFDANELMTASTNYFNYHSRLGGIVLNGLTAEQCQELNLAYCGYEKWQELLVRSGMPKERILLLPPSKHTAAESENLLLMAKEKGWKSITIMAYPYHLLRCMCQIVAAMERQQIHLKVYPKTFKLLGSDWQREMTRIVMNGVNVLGQSTVIGTLGKHVADELVRVVKYAQEGKNFTRHATIPELLQYLTERDK